MNTTVPSPIQLIVGLGNPGAEYSETRHNAGFWFVDRLAARYGGQFKPESKFFGQTCRVRVGDQECWLLKPATYMNHSGRSISALSGYFKILPEQILVAHDDLDLPVSTIRLKLGGGDGGHNGLRDTIGALGGREFWRLRIGIAHPGDSRRVVDYVLNRPSREDADEIDAALQRAVEQFPRILAGEYQQVMNRLHSEP